MTTGVLPTSRSPTIWYQVSCPFHVNRSPVNGNGASERMMAGSEAAVAEVGEGRAHVAADLGRIRAARVEAAAARRRDRARHLALEHYLLARRVLLPRVDVRDRREERFRVRVDRPRVEIVGRCRLDD